MSQDHILPIFPHTLFNCGTERKKKMQWNFSHNVKTMVTTGRPTQINKQDERFSFITVMKIILYFTGLQSI